MVDFRHSDNTVPFSKLSAEEYLQKNTIALEVLLSPEEISAFKRFDECVSNGEDYDVPIEMMKNLAEIGLVRRVTRNIYEHTAFGLLVINDELIKFRPNTANADNYTAQTNNPVGFISTLALNEIKDNCFCETCDLSKSALRTHMAICPDCGDKRCAKAKNHINKCENLKEKTCSDNQSGEHSFLELKSEFKQLAECICLINQSGFLTGDSKLHQLILRNLNEVAPIVTKALAN